MARWFCRAWQVGDLARPFVEDDGLVEEVPFQVGADEMHLWTEQFEQLQAGLDGQHQLVEFDQALVELGAVSPRLALGRCASQYLMSFGVASQKLRFCCVGVGTRNERWGLWFSMGVRRLRY